MARKPRLHVPGGLYHVILRGNGRQDIFFDRDDRYHFYLLLQAGVTRYAHRIHGFCLMTNHVHLAVQVGEVPLSKIMQNLTFRYTRWVNRRHQRIGHLFQGRFKGILVDKDSYLLELTRYVVLNPVRAGMVRHPRQYPWSSYRAMVGEAPTPRWLATDGLLAQFGERRAEAQRRYGRFVLEGIGQGSIWTGLRQQMYLGDERFVKRMLKRAEPQGDELSIPRAQRRAPAPSLAAITAKHRDRDAAIVAAYATGAYSYREIAAYFRLHLATIGRIVRAGMLQGEN